MTMTDHIHRANARSRRVPSLVVRACLALFAGGLVLALLVPTLHARGIALEGWMAWSALLAPLVIALLPQLVRRMSRRVR